VITPNIASAAEHVRREQRVLRLIGHRRECALRRRSSSVVSNQTAPYLLVLSSAWALIGVRSQWRTNAAEPVVMLAEEAEPGDTARSPIASAGWLRWARWIACAVLLAVAITTIVSEWGTLRSGLVRLGDLRWGDLRWAIYAEGLAMIAFAQLTRLLLRAGGVKLGLGSMIGLTLASNRWRRIGQLVRASEQELSRVRLPPRMLVRCISLAILNWIYDCGCLVFSLLAVGGHVPWQGILVTYGVTQLAAALPITPGGIGVVEGTLSVLLIACHVPAATAIAGVMLYRIISFWVLVPIGWGAIGILLAMRRRGRAQVTWIPRAPRANGP
jgi:uncharacterized membrane protein YbhN (UPF0104 family)